MTGLCLQDAGPLPPPAPRCLLKQGEAKHQQTQVTKPAPLISVTALVPSTWQEVPQGAVNGWYLLSRLYQFVIGSPRRDPFSAAVKIKPTSERFMTAAQELTYILFFFVTFSTCFIRFTGHVWSRGVFCQVCYLRRTFLLLHRDSVQAQQFNLKWRKHRDFLKMWNHSNSFSFI